MNKISKKSLFLIIVMFSVLLLLLNIVVANVKNTDTDAVPDDGGADLCPDSGPDDVVATQDIGRGCNIYQMDRRFGCVDEDICCGENSMPTYNPDYDSEQSEGPIICVTDSDNDGVEESKDTCDEELDRTPYDPAQPGDVWVYTADAEPRKKGCTCVNNYNFICGGTDECVQIDFGVSCVRSGQLNPCHVKYKDDPNVRCFTDEFWNSGKLQSGYLEKYDVISTEEFDEPGYVAIRKVGAEPPFEPGTATLVIGTVSADAGSSILVPVNLRVAGGDLRVASMELNINYPVDALEYVNIEVSEDLGFSSKSTDVNPTTGTILVNTQSGSYVLIYEGEELLLNINANIKNGVEDTRTIEFVATGTKLKDYNGLDIPKTMMNGVLIITSDDDGTGDDGTGDDGTGDDGTGDDGTGDDSTGDDSTGDDSTGDDSTGDDGTDDDEVVCVGEDDFDNDGVCNFPPDDNCWNVANSCQRDEDHNGEGDACDSIPEGMAEDDDGVVWGQDNCPFMGNGGQEDTDGDCWGNVCDNCPNFPNPGQEDADGDGVGNNCDAYPYEPQCQAIGDIREDGEDCLMDEDYDTDNVRDGVDNCPGIFCDIEERNTPACYDKYGNNGQADLDEDGIGDKCDDCFGVGECTNLCVSDCPSGSTCIPISSGDDLSSISPGSITDITYDLSTNIYCFVTGNRASNLCVSDCPSGSTCIPISSGDDLSSISPGSITDITYDLSTNIYCFVI